MSELEERTEYAIGYAGGSMLVRPAEGERYWPDDVWAQTHRRVGNKVYVRRVLVLSDWEEVTE